MKKIAISILLLFLAFNGFAKTWTITNSGFEFTPDTITINFGDSVKFSVSTFHIPVEISKTTWEADGKTPLPGFSLPAGGGLVLPAQLGIGTHYYVCTNHNDMKMKGVIIVKQMIDIKAPKILGRINIFPNPSNGIFTINSSNSNSTSDINFEITDLQGKIIYNGAKRSDDLKIEVDLVGIEKGVYFITLKNGTEIIREKIIISE